jgi:hypothetical protein
MTQRWIWTAALALAASLAAPLAATGQGSLPFLGRWATQPEGQTASLAQICANEDYGFLEITPGKVYAYESDCDITEIRREGARYVVVSDCFAEGDAFTEALTIEMQGPDQMWTNSFIEYWHQSETLIYVRCR